MLFSISAIMLFISSGLFLMSSAGMLSQPILLLSFSFFAASFTSSLLIGSLSFCGVMSGMGLVLSCLKIFSK